MVDATASKIVKAGLTTYFFDVKGTKDIKPFLVITESSFKGEGSERQRSRIVVFPEQIKEFSSSLQEIANTWG